MRITADKNLNNEKMKKFKAVSPPSENICMKALVKLHRPGTTLVFSRDIACKMHSLTGFGQLLLLK